MLNLRGWVKVMSTPNYLMILFMVALIAETGLEYVWTIINGVLFAFIE